MAAHGLPMYCDICQKGPFGGPIPATAHFESRIHREKEQVCQTVDPTKQNFCDICKIHCTSPRQYQEHIASPRHMAAEQRSKVKRAQGYSETYGHMQNSNSDRVLSPPPPIHVQKVSQDLERSEVEPYEVSFKGEYGCGLCQVPYTSEAHALQHISGANHRKAKSRNSTFTSNNSHFVSKCNACGDIFPNSSAAEEHFASETHRLKVSAGFTNSIGQGSSWSYNTSPTFSDLSSSACTSESVFTPQDNLVHIQLGTQQGNAHTCTSAEMDQLFQQTVQQIQEEVHVPTTARNSDKLPDVIKDTKDSNQARSAVVKKEYSFQGSRGLCYACNIELTSEQHASQHLNGQKHLKNKQKWLQSQNSGASANVPVTVGTERSPGGADLVTPDKEYEFDTYTNRGRCFVCNIDLTSRAHAQQHLDGRNHAKNKQKPPNYPVENSQDLNFCTVCQKGFTGPESAAQHYASEKHRSKEAIFTQQLQTQARLSPGFPTQGEIGSTDRTEWHYCDVCKCRLNSAAQLAIHEASSKHIVEEEKLARAGRPIEIVQSEHRPQEFTKKPDPLRNITPRSKLEEKPKMFDTGSHNSGIFVPPQNQYRGQILGEFELMDLGLEPVSVPSCVDLLLSSLRQDDSAIRSGITLPTKVEFEESQETVPKVTPVSNVSGSQQSLEDLRNMNVPDKKIPEKVPVNQALHVPSNSKNDFKRMDSDTMPQLEPIGSKNYKDHRNAMLQRESSENSSDQSLSSGSSFGSENDPNMAFANNLKQTGQATRPPGGYPYKSNTEMANLEMERSSDQRICSSSSGQGNKPGSDMSRALKNRTKGVRKSNREKEETNMSDSEHEVDETEQHGSSTGSDIMRHSGKRNDQGEKPHGLGVPVSTGQAQISGAMSAQITSASATSPVNKMSLNQYRTASQLEVLTVSPINPCAPKDAASSVPKASPNAAFTVKSSNLTATTGRQTEKLSHPQPKEKSENPFKFHKFYCETCNRPMNTRKALDDHMRGRLHMQKVAVEPAMERHHPPLVKEFCNYGNICAELTETTPRQYQRELFAKAMEKDTVVFLPTGTGKTLISCMVVSAMLEQNPTRQVVFLVDKVLLVLQQSDYLIKEIGNRTYRRVDPDNLNHSIERKLKIAVLCGEQQSTDGVPLWKHDLIVVTAAFYENLISKRVLRWEDLSLVVFDEAHHCVKNHPFNQLLKKHHISMDARLRPKVLGLTASPAGKGTVAMTSSMLQQLMLQLGETTMAIVEDNVPQLKKFQSNAELVINNVKWNKKENDLCLELQLHLLNCYMRLCEETNMMARWNLGLSANQRRNLSNEDKIRCAQELTGDVLNSLEITVDRVQPNSDTINSRMFVQNLTTHVKYICMTLNSLYEAGVPAALEDLQSLMAQENCSFEFAESFGLECEKLKFAIDSCLQTEGFTTSEPTPIIIKYSSHISSLIQILNDPTMIDWRKEDENPMALILVKERSTAFYLCNSLSNHESIKDKNLSVTFVVGHGSGGSDGGMRVNQQKRVLEQIKNHEHHIIVATSVAEEGIDIPECQLVVSMNTPTTVKAMVQMRGRARKAKSKFVVLCSDESEVGKLDDLKKREENMITAANLLVQCQNRQPFQR